MKKLNLLISAALVVVSAAAMAQSKFEKDHAASFKANGIAGMDRLDRDETQKFCSDPATLGGKGDAKKREAIEKANNTPYGLSAGIWTDKGSRILWTAQQLKAGVIWANTFNKFDPASPFGGYKESGWGREGGRHGLSAYLKGDFS